MEYNCVLAGDTAGGVDGLLYLLTDAPIFQVQNAQQQQQEEKEQQQLQQQQLLLLLKSLSLTPPATGSVPPRRVLELPHPSLPELKIRVFLQAAYAPSDMMREEEAPAVVVFVFFMSSLDFMQRIRAEWAPKLRSLNRTPTVILVGMTHVDKSGAAMRIQPGEMALVAKELQARAFFLLDGGSSESNSCMTQLAEIRDAIARACIGELCELGHVTELNIYERQKSSSFMSPLRSPLESPSLHKVYDSSIASPISGWSGGHAPGVNGALWGFKRHPRTGRIYYVNRMTKKSQYKRPPNYDGEEPELTLEERVEAERERQEKLQREADLQREHEEIAHFNAKMEENQQRVKVLQSGVRQLESAVERLRMQSGALAFKRESNKANREHVATLRAELSAKEQGFLRESFQLQSRHEEQMALVQQALKEAEGEEGEKDEKGITRHENEGMNGSIIASSRRGKTMREIHTIQAEMQSTVDSTRVVVSALRGLLEKSVKQRERNAIVHAELTSTLRLTETLMQRTSAVEAEGRRVRAALMAERASMEAEEKVLQPLLAAREARLQRERTRRQSSEVDGLNEMMMMDEVHLLEEKIAAAKESLRPLKRATSVEDTHELAYLHRARNIRACVTAFAKWANHVIFIFRLKRGLYLRMERYADLSQYRQFLLGGLRERYVQERLSLLHDWYNLEAEGNHSGGGGVGHRGSIRTDTASRMRLVEERMDQLDTVIDRLKTHATIIEHNTNVHERMLQRYRGVLEKLPLLESDASSPLSGDAVMSCWLLLAERLLEVVARLQSVVFSMEALNDTDGTGADAVGVMGEEKGTIYTEHMRLLQQELWRFSGRSLLRHFRLEELRDTARRLSHQHGGLTLKGRDNNNNNNKNSISSSAAKRIMANLMSVADVSDSHGNGDEGVVMPEKTEELSLLQPAVDLTPASKDTIWMEKLLLFILAPVTGDRNFDVDGALAIADKSAAVCSPVSYKALRERLQQAYA
ncbi:hypothetical protein MOQ_007595 [Trypanosoma cruzi marinkellei]|uniref:WW domain-containing protein n=1 Tax=Trypanosoma cruzi marinkellei TaxID=85056 RepID=K2N290_TRYCR|nr:hypothetical protein MOQ_007595 [Trypanosoma cruzi marinkellei]